MDLQPASAAESKVEAFQRRHRVGLLTILFTDIVGSTGLKQQFGDAEAVRLIQEHHALVREVLARFSDAEEIETAGDSFLIVFARPSDAVKFSLDLQEAIRSADWLRGVADRIGIHVGEVMVQEQSEATKLFGIQVDTAARVMGLATGSQILLSRLAFDSSRQSLRDRSVDWFNHGPYSLKGLDEPLEICEVRARGAAEAVTPPPSSEKAQRLSVEGDLVLGWRPALGQEIPHSRWILEQKLGEGGFGEVWLARHEKLKERRVFKFCFKADRVRALKREMTLFRLFQEQIGEHPNIVRIYDANLDEPPYHLEMEYVEGRDLRHWAAEQGDLAQIPEAIKLEIVAQAAEGLHAAHQSGIIHRDVKPGNILISEIDASRRESAAGLAASSAFGTSAPTDLGGRKGVGAKLTDFGIGQVLSQEYLAAVTKAGFTQTLLGSTSSHTGTQLYMAPELLAGQPATPQSDIYSLGVVLYQLLIGDFARPVTTDWSDSVADSLLREDLKHCFAGKASDRFPSAANLARNLRQLPERRAELERRKSEQLARERAAYRRGIARTTSVAAVIVVAVLFLALLAFREARRANREAGRARSAEIGERLQRTQTEEQRDAARRHLVRMSVANSTRLHQEGDLTAALLWSAEALRLVQGDPAQEAIHRLRYASFLQHGPRLVHLLHLGEALNHFAISPDGRTIVTPGEGGAIRLWDALTGEPITPVWHHSAASNRVSHCAFSSDSSRFVTVCHDETAQVWDARTGQPIGPPLRHNTNWVQLAKIDPKSRTYTNWVQFGQFSPDGRRVATAGGDHRAQIWDAATGISTTPPLVHTATVYEVRFSPDGKRVITASIDGTAKVWDAFTGETVFPPLRHEATVINAAFSPDGRYIATTSIDKTARLWDAQTGKAIGPALQHSGSIPHVSFSADSQKIVTAANGQAYLWDIASGNLVRHFPHQFVQQRWMRWPEISGDGTFILTAVSTNGHLARFFDVRTGEPFGEPLPHNRGILHAAVSPDSRRVVTGGMEGAARVWEVPLPAGPASQNRVRSLINRLPFSPDGRRVVFSNSEGSAQVLDANTGQPVGGPLTHSTATLHEGCTSNTYSNAVLHAVFSPDGKWLATGDRKRIARLWDAVTGRPLHPPFAPAKPLEGGEQALLLFFSEDSRRLAAVHIGHSTYAAVEIWDVASGRRISGPIYPSSYVEHTAFNPDGTRIVTSGVNGTARVWDADTGQPVTPPMWHDQVVTYGNFSADGRLVATASLDQSVRVWDAQTGELVMMPLKHSSPVHYCAFLPEGRKVLTESEDGAWIWEIPSETRPIEDLLVQAQVLSGRQIDESRALVSRRTQDLAEDWRKLRAVYGPALFPSASAAPVEAKRTELPARIQVEMSRFAPYEERMPKRTSFFVDLSPYQNLELTRDWSRMRPGFNLSALGQGRQKFGETEFEIGPGIVQLVSYRFQTYGGDFRADVIGIPFRKRCRHLHFLHSSHGGAYDELFAYYRIHFSNGPIWEIPVTGRELNNSIGSPGDVSIVTRSRLAHAVKTPSGDEVRLFQTSWENPLPQLEIESIDFVSNVSWSAAILVAITLE